MKKYHKNNFFKHTFCEFEEVIDFKFPENNFFKSASNSYYFYTKEGVYRKSNHWGRVANCRWRIITKSKYKNQRIIVGFAKWTDFVPLQSNGNFFSIQVNFQDKTSRVVSKGNTTSLELFTLKEATLRNKEIQKLFKEKHWLSYANHSNTSKLVQQVILELISSTKSINKIKSNTLNSI